MNKPKQATLFQSWGSRSQQAANAPPRTSSRQFETTGPGGHPDHVPESVIDLCDDDDEDQQLARALEESLAHYQNTSGNSSHQPAASRVTHPTASEAGTLEINDGNVSFGIDNTGGLDDSVNDQSDCLSQWKPSDLPDEDLPGFDSSAGRLWIYPTNYPVREYQLTIVKQALVKNTLVTLPTGLGKTFIASVVMYNFYRWYPEGKVVFMAPTKPLVAQQIEACYHIMGIPREDTAEMTGSMNPTERQKAWRDRRVFFLTPQVLTNDLSRGTCAAEAVKCLVVDEAHKALGNHAYCQVVRELVKYTRQFRILALSATPGSDIKAVQQVISNLLISHIELRGEDSADIKPYTHERIVEKIVIPLGDELNSLKTKYIEVLSVVVKRLIRQRVLYNRDPTHLSKFLILKARDQFRQNPPESLPRNQFGVVEGDFAMAMSLYHGYELLQLHGLRSLYNYLQGIVSGDKSYNRTRTELMRNPAFCDIMDILREKFQPSAVPDEKSSSSKASFAVGHPKMVKLEQVVLEHFHKFQADGQATRVMIFSQYRDSVQEITQMLQQHEPLIKVMSFIGQSSTGKATKGFTQKEQLKVMQAFRTGGYNTLVSTCVGEEGLDIGDVDLIVCFDAHKSPIRLVQRMGRTGRKRQGRIVMLVTEGKEEQIYNHSQYTKKSIHKTILNGAKSLAFYTSNPRMIPANVTPACHRMHITVQSPFGKGKGKGKKSQGKISFAKAKPGGRKNPSLGDGGISLEEFAELKSAGTAVTTKCLPTLKMVSLNTADEEDSQVVWKEGELNLSDWLPWLNSLQDTSQFGHSRRSKQLVDLLEFTDLQQMLPPSEDNYGQEMQIYLNMDDVITDSKRPASGDITQFCVPAEKPKDNTDTDGDGKQPPRKGSNRARAKRRKTVLPEIEVEKDSDESDTLPDVDFSKPSTSAAQKISSPPSSQRQKEKKRKMRSDRSPRISSVLPATENDDDFDDFEDAGLNHEQDNEKENLVQSVIPGRSENTAVSTVDHLNSDTATSTAVNKSVNSFSPRAPSCRGRSGAKRVNQFNESRTHDTSENIGNCVADLIPINFEDSQDFSKQTVLCKESAGETENHRERDKIYRVPSPPNLEEIPAVLDKITTEDLLAVDLCSLMKDYVCSLSGMNEISHSIAEAQGNAQAKQHHLLSNSAHEGPFGCLDGVSGEQDIPAADPLVVSREKEMAADPLVVSRRKETAAEPLVVSRGKENMSKQTADMRLQIEQTFSDSLSDDDFDNVTMILMQKTNARKRHKSSSHSDNSSVKPLSPSAPSARQSGEHSESQWAKPPERSDSHTTEQTVVNPELSQTEPVSKKPLFKDIFDSNDSAVTNTENHVTNSVNRRKTGLQKREKSGFVYNLGESSDQNRLRDDSADEMGEREVVRKRAEEKSLSVSTVTASVPLGTEAVTVEAESEQTSALAKESAGQNVLIIHKEKQRSSKSLTCAESPQTGVSDWMTGKQLLQANCNQQNQPNSALAKETSVSDSFLHQHFLDDEDDMFEDEVDLPVILRKKTPPVSSVQSKKSALTVPQATVHVDEKIDEDLKELAYTPALFSPEKENDRRPSVSPKTPAPKTGQSHHSDSMFTFTQALDCVHSHSPTTPSYTDSKESSYHVRTGESHQPKRKGHSPMEKPKHDSPSGRVQIPVSTVCPPYVADENMNTGVQQADVEEESPNFDLGFDFDEDIIPPSPEAETTVSQAAFRSQLSLKPAFVEESVTKENPLCNIPEAQEFEDDDILFAADGNNMDEHSPCFSSSFQTKPNSSTNKCVTESVLSSERKECDPDANEINDFYPDHFDFETQPPEIEDNPSSPRRHSPNPKFAASPSQGFVCQQQKEVKPDLDETRSPVLTQSDFAGMFDDTLPPVSDGAQKKSSLSKSEHNKQSLSSCKIDDPSTVSSLSNYKEKTLPSSHCKSLAPSTVKVVNGARHLQDSSPLQVSNTEPQKHEHSDEDLGQFAPRFVLLHDLDFDDDFDDEGKEPPITPIQNERTVPASVYCSTPLSSKKPFRFSFQGKTNETPTGLQQAHHSKTTLEDDGSDFEESFIIRRKPKTTKTNKLLCSDSEADASHEPHVRFKVPDKQQLKRKNTDDEVRKKKQKKRKRGCTFLDDEAELSDDVEVSSDEGEEDLDMLEGSFIDNATQLSQPSQTDMQAVYMKSVRSPAGHGHARGARFRLQYKSAHVDVFSQPPRHDEEESQYQEDSFCVGSDDEDEEDDEDEGDKGSYASETEDDDFDLTVLKRPRPPSTAKRKKKKQTVKQVAGRKRVRQLADSSSNEEDDFNRLPPTQISPAPKTKRTKAVRALLSSSEDNIDTSACEKSSSFEKKQETSSAKKSSSFERKEEPSSAKKMEFVCDKDEASQGFQCSEKKNSEKQSDLLDPARPTAPSTLWSEGHGGSRGAKQDASERNSAFKSMPKTIDREKHMEQDFVDLAEDFSVRGKTETESNPFSLDSCRGKSVTKSAIGSCGFSRPVTVPAVSGTSGSAISETKFTSIASRERGKLVVLVDSREISGAQDIVSALRLQHNMLVCTRQLAACDYVLSDRMAVDRLTWSSFSLSTNRSKLCERVQQMQSLYDRCVIIVEKDRIKPGEEKSVRNQQHSKYVDSIIAQLGQTAIRLFFTENQSETASLLSGLCNSENRKGMAITAPVNLNQDKEQVVKFYMTIPRLSITHALNLSFNFATVNDFLRSSITDIQKKGRMSFSRATEVHSFLRHRFSAALLSLS